MLSPWAVPARNLAGLGKREVKAAREISVDSWATQVPSRLRTSLLLVLIDSRLVCYSYETEAVWLSGDVSTISASRICS